MKICTICGKSYYVPRYRVDKTKFCSLDCQNHKQYESTIKMCKGCGKEFEVSNSRMNKKYCSEHCRTLKSITNKQKRVLQKLSSANSRGYGSAYLRRRVLLDNNKKCVKCGYDEYTFNLDVHHINNNPNDNSYENLTVLCVICHRILHNVYKSDFNEFIKGEKK